MQKDKVKNKLYTSFFIILLIFITFYYILLPIYSGGGGTYFQPVNNISNLLKEKKNIGNALSLVVDYDKKLSDSNTKYQNALNTLPIDKLDKVLPKAADPVIIVYEISKIVTRPGSNMLLISPKVSDDGAASNSNKKFNTITVSMELQGSYDNLKNLLKDFENSERIYNVTSLSFASSKENPNAKVNKYSLVVETYYLKQSN